jgi:tetratricopeptide (TPR) repeat protein
MRRCALIVALFSSLFFLSGSASAQENTMHLFVDGVEAYESGLYQEAVTSLTKAIELEPENLEFHYYLGLTYSAMERYEEALGIFEMIADKEPIAFQKAFFDIAAVYAKQEQHQKTIDTLTRFEALEPKEPRLHLEKGYAFHKLKQYDRAIESFNKAKDLDPTMLQLVYYNIGAAYFEADAFDKAEEAFAASIEADPATSLARDARQGIVHARGAKKAQKSWYLSGSFGWFYDDNVLQKALEQAHIISPTGKALDEGDQFQVFHARGGYKLLNRKDLELGAGYSLYSVGYKDLVENNILAHVPHLYLTYNRHPFYFSIPYEFSYYRTGGKENGEDIGLYVSFGINSNKKLKMHALSPALTIVEPHNLKTEITAAYQNKEYLDNLTSDAGQVSLGIVQHYKFPDAQIHPRVGFTYGSEDADEEIFSYHYYQFLLGLASALPWGGIWTDVSLTYEKTDFHHNPLYAAIGEREDAHYIFVLSIAKPLSDIFQLALYYSHTRNDSNVSSSGMDPYEFKKNVYGLTIMALF